MKLFTSISYSSSFLSVKSTLPLNWKPSNYSWFLWLTHLSISKVSLILINSNSKWLCTLQAFFFFLLSCNCLHSLSSQLWYPMILLTWLQPFLKGPLIGLFPNKIFHTLWLFPGNNESIFFFYSMSSCSRANIQYQLNILNYARLLSMPPV